VLTVNGYYEWVKGGSIPYAHIDGPTDYERKIQLNAKNTQFFHYKGVNAKLEVAAGTDTNVTLIGSYDERDGHQPVLDADFNAVDIARQESRDKLKTSSAELRFDSEWSDQFSTPDRLLITATKRWKGHGVNVTRFLPFVGLNLTRVNETIDTRKGDSYAAFVEWLLEADQRPGSRVGPSSRPREAQAGGKANSVNFPGTIDSLMLRTSRFRD
jgi:iron complex outermembrane receptor protein